MDNEIIFKALCKETSVVLKTLIEMLSQISAVENIESTSKTIKQLFLKISKEGLEIFSDSMKVVTSVININKTFFLEYEFNDDESLCIGISLDILKSSFKNIHKNDIISIIIEKYQYNNFPDKIIFTVNNIKGFSMKFNTIQNICNDTNFINYHNILDVSSQRLSNLYKEIGGIKKKVFLNFKNKELLRLQSSNIDISENWVDFNLKTESDIIKNLPEIILKSEYFKIISKLSTFSDIISINVNLKGNLLFKTNIKNNTGDVSIKILNLKK